MNSNNDEMSNFRNVSNNNNDMNNNIFDPHRNNNDINNINNDCVKNNNMNYSSLSNENTIDDNGYDINYFNDDDNDNNNCNHNNDSNHSIDNNNNTNEKGNSIGSDGNNKCHCVSHNLNDGIHFNRINNASDNCSYNDNNNNSNTNSNTNSNSNSNQTSNNIFLNCEEENITKSNVKNAFFNNVDDVRSFERGILYLTEDELTYISNAMNLLGFRFYEINCEKSKSEKRNTFTAISKRHLNEIKNLRCSLSNNIYDAGKRKSKKSFDKFYSKEEWSAITKENNNDKQKETNKKKIINNNNEDEKSTLLVKGDRRNTINEKNNNNVSNSTHSTLDLRGNNRQGSSSSLLANSKYHENEKIQQNKSNLTRKGGISKNEVDNSNNKNSNSNVNKNSHGTLTNAGKGKMSRYNSSSTCNNNNNNNKKGAPGAGGGKEMLKKRQRNSSNFHEDSTVEEYEQHKRTYKKRVYKTRNLWKNNCFKILHKLKKKEYCCWFLEPVNPELDGIPNYFNIIKNPMDFQTIENKLLNNKYNNPFEWQQDVRQIFFNAFTYHKVKNCVWNDAYKLAKEFDRLVKQNSKMESLLSEFTKNTNSVYLDMNKYNEILSNNYDYDDNISRSRNSSSSYSSNSSDNISSDNNNNKRNNTTNSRSNYHPAKRRNNNNMVKTGAGGGSGFMNSNVNTSSSNIVYPIHNKKGDKLYNTNKQTSNVSSKNTHEKFINNKKDNFSNLIKNNSNNNNNSNNSIEFEPPSIGTIPEPPGIQKIGINDKGLNNYQVNLLFKNLRRLAPNQRRAALEIIQDDLGILAENHMFDKFFTFDTDLLSIEKQKRIFLYINHMGRINLEQYKASLISSEQIPNCNIAKGKIPMKNINNNKNYMNNNNNNDHYDKRRANRYISSSSNSSDSSSSNSSDSSTFSTSSDDDSDTDSDSDMDSDSYDKKKVKRQLPSDKKKEMANNFLDNRRKSLPQYKPVDENKKNLEIREDVMGMHADFLASMDTPKNPQKNRKNSGSAWPEWKGQVIQQAILTQHQTNVPINKKELIAEGYDAKI
ncbi:bromodomain protein 2, putative [Plasmodium malariae]|uniref:Bromodomain protein 2, putative n=2 Tax=Plasmodium malariae TaxID=5858 RepID=A0A1A8WCS1_PLAMA|nr:bromodomain protein 2, putative [Plasmodium malariae]SBS90660.1 bromodomain protein 2, putative [Plasmodium malariae]SCP03421.1 bromodomain protein 2, putative [Plasmodium malariae]